MQPALERSVETGPSVRQSWWLRHRAAILRPAIGLLAAISFVWLGYQFWRLVSAADPIWPTSPVGAIDLRAFRTMTHRWFEDSTHYAAHGALYPPATQAILWLFVGWPGETAARLLWAATALAALAALVYLAIRESGATAPSERALVACMLLSTYAVGATIGNGQLGVHVLAALLAGLLLLRDRSHGWPADLLAVVLILLALAKPSLTAPFFWLVLLLPRKPWPAALLAVLYVGLTLYAASFQDSDVLSLFAGWLARGSQAAAAEGYANVQVWLGSLGLQAWIFPASLLVVSALGLWTFHYRAVDFWVLAGVTGVVARMWAYHGWYDDLLLLLPTISLFRIARQGASPRDTDVVAGVLLAMAVLATLAPGGLYLFPAPWKQIYMAGQTAVWLAMLAFLLIQAERQRRCRSMERPVRRQDSSMRAR
jgi:hypothetical protein